MQVDKNDIICGYPAPKVRDILRKLRCFRYGAKEACKRSFKVGDSEAKEILNKLTEGGYIEKSGDERWKCTPLGNRLSLVRFVRRLTREEIEIKLAEVKKRIELAYFIHTARA